MPDPLILCVDIGGTSAKVGLVSANGQVSHLQSIPSKPTVEEFAEKLVALITLTAAQAGPELDQMGVAIAGFVDEDRSGLAYNSNLPWLEKYPLRQRLQQSFPGYAIELEVDSNAATMAEYEFGSGRGCDRFLCLTCGTGLGVGMSVAGVPLRFAYGCMGDAGHTVVQRDGPLCTCGGHGCAEALISSDSLARNYQTLLGTGREVTLRDVIEAAQAGDAQAISVLEQAGEWLGVAVATLSNMFFPDHIAIAGGLSAAGDLVLKPAERVFRKTACLFATSKTTFGRAVLGSTATLIGAAWPFLKGKVSYGESVSR